MIANEDINSIRDLAGLSRECLSVKEFVEASLIPMTRYLGADTCGFTTVEGTRENAILKDIYTVDFSEKDWRRYQHFNSIDPLSPLMKARLKHSVDACGSTNEVIESKHAFINSDYYQGNLKPLGLYASLYLSVGDKENVYGHYAFLRNRAKDDYDPTDHLKARLASNQIASGLGLLMEKEKNVSKSLLLESLMGRANLKGYLTIDSRENVCLHSSGLENHFPFLKNQSPSSYWHLIKERLPPHAVSFIKDGFKSFPPHTITQSSCEIKKCEGNDLPTMSISIDTSRGYTHKQLAIFVLDTSRMPIIAQHKLDLFKITPKQREIIHYVGAGLANAQVAHAMGISIKTLESHFTSIYSKTRSHNKQSLLYTLRPNT
ncbi:helix-turn-helix transcriptional regulator [Kordiimonas aquimaris]|uniref:helix-turn-helix transcriptional regulator n=1 Tax=Kordiimonas aquimaris TaxID=707591 RepID=UPI0021CFE2EB|nr:helix-turn-helix transcriptional regulator [Kordiimonas aquimaris]